MSLPGRRDETLHQGSTVEGLLLDRIQDRIVDVHERENRAEQTYVIHPVSLFTNLVWTYSNSTHLYTSTGSSTSDLRWGLGRFLPPSGIVKRAFMLLNRPASTSIDIFVGSFQQTVQQGAVSSLVRHATFDDAQVFDDWELVEAVPVADETNDPDSDLVLTSGRAYFIGATSDDSGIQVGPLKLVIERPV